MRKQAYYLEYPDKEFTVMLMVDDDDQTINTYEGPVEPGHFIADLMTDGYEVDAHTSRTVDSKVREGKLRTWERIDTKSLPETTLGVPGPDGKMYAKRRQVRGGQVREADDSPGKGNSFWGEWSGPKGGVEVVPLPKEYEASHR